MQDQSQLEGVRYGAYTNGHYTVGMYLVDLPAYGVKDTMYIFNEPIHMIEENMNRVFDDETFEACEYPLAHNIIYGAIEFARAYDIEPCKDYRITQYILKEDTEDIPLIDIEFGKDGEPLIYDAAPEDWDDDQYAMDDIPDDLTLQDFKELVKESGPEKFTKILNNVFHKYCDPDYPSEESLKDFFDVESYITYEPIQDLNKFKNKDEERTHNEIFRALAQGSVSTKKLKEYDRKLRAMIKSNPDNPLLYNNLINVNTILENNDTVVQLIKESYERHPDYLFARLEYAHLLMNNDELEKVPAVFDNTYHIEEMYPDREAFHISEVVNLYAILCKYCLLIDDYKHASYFYKLVTELTDFEEAEKIGLIPLVEMTLQDMVSYQMQKIFECLPSEDALE